MREYKHPASGNSSRRRRLGVVAFGPLLVVREPRRLVRHRVEAPVSERAVDQREEHQEPRKADGPEDRPRGIEERAELFVELHAVLLQLLDALPDLIELCLVAHNDTLLNHIVFSVNVFLASDRNESHREALSSSANILNSIIL